ncbi:MAG: zf-HC2 domain-containing protein [Planctomycetes bacterium]|nr:zf-HC2 domain-containing protein [Planctomycetota bacterium]
MQECNDIRSQVDDWLDDAVSGERSAEIERHLAACDGCRACFARHESLVADLSALAGAANRMGSEKSVVTTTKSRWTRVSRAAAIIALTAGIAWFTSGYFQADRETLIVENTGITSQPGPIINSSALPADELPFRVEVDDSHFAVNVNSGDPAIHIVWVYQDQLKIESNKSDESDNSDVQPAR